MEDELKEALTTLIDKIIDMEWDSYCNYSITQKTYQRFREEISKSDPQLRNAIELLNKGSKNSES